MRIGVLIVNLEVFWGSIETRVQLMDMLKERHGLRCVLGTSEDFTANGVYILCLCDEFEDHERQPNERYNQYRLVYDSCELSIHRQELEHIKFKIIKEEDYLNHTITR